MLDPEPGSQDAVVASWKEYLTGRNVEHEILTITGSSPGSMLQAGLQQARFPLIAYAPCRPEYRPDDLGSMLDRPFLHGENPEDPPSKEMDHVHLISAFRAGVPVPWVFRATGWIYRQICWVLLGYSPQPLPGWLGWKRMLGSWLVRLVFGVQYQDTTCPFRLVRKEILSRIPIQSTSSFAHAELAAKANFLGCLLGEAHPVRVKPEPFRHGLVTAWRDARELFRNPDFGPIFLPAASPDPVASPEGVSTVDNQDGTGHVS